MLLVVKGMRNLDGRERALKLLDQAQVSMLRREERTVKSLHRAYATARKNIRAALMDAYETIDSSDPTAVRRLATNVSLFNAITRNMDALEAEFGDLLADSLQDVSSFGIDSVKHEIRALVRELGIPFHGFAIDDIALLVVRPAVEQIPGIVGSLSSQIIKDLRMGLIEGLRFSDLATRVLSPAVENSSTFRRGMTSAELMVRRTVNEANNQSRNLFMQGAKEQLPTLKKQAIAHIGSRTTDTCLRVHGQIKNIDEPYILSGQPSFARKQMLPPFHWNCRTSSAPYMKAWEERSQLQTADMRKEAQEQTRKNGE